VIVPVSTICADSDAAARIANSPASQRRFRFRRVRDERFPADILASKDAILSIASKKDPRHAVVGDCGA